MHIKIIQIAYLLLLLPSCEVSQEAYIKLNKGLEYKIISDGKGNKLESGNFFEIQFEQTYKGTSLDTVLYDSKNFANQIVEMDSVGMPPAYYKVFSQARKGDSIVAKQLVDSVMKEGNNPPFMKKGGFLIAHYKVVNVYTTKQAADNAYKIQRQHESIDIDRSLQKKKTEKYQPENKKRIEY